MFWGSGRARGKCLRALVVGLELSNARIGRNFPVGVESFERIRSAFNSERGRSFWVARPAVCSSMFV